MPNDGDRLLSIVVIDDEPIFLEQARDSYTSNVGFSCSTYESIEEAQKDIETWDEPPIACMVDLNLSSNENGLDFVAWMRRQSRLPALLVATAQVGATQDAFSAAKLGAHLWVDKSNLVSAEAFVSTAQRGITESLKERSNAVAKVEEAVASVPDMVGQIVHELDNRIQPIKNNAALIKGYLEEDQLDDLFRNSAAVDMVLEDIEQCVRLVADLEEYANSKTITVSREWFRFEEKFSDYFERLRARIAELNINVLEMDDVYLDPNVLPLVLNPIIRNAKDHVGEAVVVELTVSTKIIGEIECLTIEVMDNGPGVPERLRRSIFLPGKKGGNTRKKTGKGLGLSSALTYASTHECGGINGSVVCMARPDGQEGACFRISIPYRSSS